MHLSVPAGKSDPFVELFTTKDDMRSTRVINNSLTPEWNEVRGSMHMTAACLAGCSAGRSAGCLSVWLHVLLVMRLSGWLAGWLAGWP
jgi:hypothetical protein